MLKLLGHLHRYGVKPIHPSPEYLPLVEFLLEGGVTKQVEQDSHCPGNSLHVDLRLQEEQYPVQPKGVIELVGKAEKRGGKKGNICQAF